MPSHLRNQTIFSPVSAHNTASSFPHGISQQPPQKKQKMTVTQTYRLAHSARGKLSSEASRGDHDLRLLVGHANLLDSLMLELHEAENEQEAWFNETVKSTSTSTEPKHVQWKDEVIAKHQLEIPDASDSDSDDEYDAEEEDDEPVTMTAPLRKVRSPPAPVSPIEEDSEEEEEEDDEEDDDFHNTELALVRTRSHSVDEPLHDSDPPELVHEDNSDDSDDESPVSPQPAPMPLPVKTQNKQQQKRQEHIRKQEEALLEDGYFIPEQAPMIAAY